MRLTRLYIPAQELSADTRIVLNPDHAHYLLRVLRMESGRELIVFNAESGGWLAALEVQGKKAVAHIQTLVQPVVVAHDVWMLLAPLKKETWVFAVEKITELGAAALMPVITEYTQNAKVNEERTKANMVEASQQCERTDVPHYKAAEKLESMLKKWDASRVLYVALEREDTISALDAFDVKKPAAILIGPEGGFSEREKEILSRYDFVKPVSLGHLILRAETAAIAALSMWAGKANSRA